MATLVRPWIVRYLLDGRIVRKGTRGASIVRQRSRKWYGQGIPGMPPGRRVALASNKSVAQRMLADLVDRAERGHAGMVDLDHARRPIAEHLAEFESESAAAEMTPKYRRLKFGRIRRLIESCRFRVIADITAARVQEQLAAMRSRSGPSLDPRKPDYSRAEIAELLGIQPASVSSLLISRRITGVGHGRARRYSSADVAALVGHHRGSSVATTNYYLQELKSFTAWLVAHGRLHVDPLASVEFGREELDRRHDRRNLTAAELGRLFESVQLSDRTFRGLAGRDRHALYLTAAGTGFRVDELSQLTPAAVRLDREPPTISLAASATKNRKPVQQPVPSAVVDVLREYLVGREPTAPIWPGSWPDRAAEMLRRDLELAGIEYVTAGPNGPLYADFHSLRHSYITQLDRSRMSPKEAQALARHSSPALTIGRYTHASLDELAAAVDRISLGSTERPTTAVEMWAAIGIVLWQGLVQKVNRGKP